MDVSTAETGTPESSSGQFPTLTKTNTSPIESSYPLGHDDAEHFRLEKLQLVFRTVLGGNVHVPISNKGDAMSILDVGTGWGEWVKQVATEFPSATVYGLDIAPINRDDVPSNCKFVTHDLNAGLPFGDSSMDFVNSRYIHIWSVSLD